MATYHTQVSSEADPVTCPPILPHTYGWLTFAAIESKSRLKMEMPMTDRTVDGVKPYDGPAAGWGALRAVAKAVRKQMGASTDMRALLHMNHPDGFDCPGCA